MAFSLDIKQWANKALLEANNKTSAVFETLVTSVVALSPEPPGYMGYSDGDMRANWYSTVGRMSAEITSAKDPTGATSLNRMKTVLASKPFLGRDNVLFLSNNLPYIYRVEILGYPRGYDDVSGWYWTGNAKPYMMVALSMVNIKGAYS